MKLLSSSLTFAFLFALTQSSVISSDDQASHLSSPNLQSEPEISVTPSVLPSETITTQPEENKAKPDLIVAEVEKKIDAETNAEALVINIPGLFGDENDGIDYQNVDMDELDSDLLLGRKTSD